MPEFVIPTPQSSFSSPLPPTPPTPSLPPEPKTNWFKILLLSLAGLAIVLGLVTIGIWYIGQRQAIVVPTEPPEEPTAPTSSIEEQTKDWEVYSDPDVLGISFKYPKDWEFIFEPHLGKNEPLLQNSCDLEAGERCSKMVISGTKYYPERPLAEDYFILFPTDRIVRRETIDLGGEEAQAVEYFPGSYRSAEDAPVALLREIKVIHNQKVYSFSCWEVGKDADSIATSDDWENKEIFDQILSTFQFTTPTATDETANWETYTDDLEKISISYPREGKSCNLDDGSIVRIFLDPEIDKLPICPDKFSIVNAELAIMIRKFDVTQDDAKALFSRDVDIDHFKDSISKQTIGEIEGYKLVYKFGPLNQVSYIIKDGKAYEFFIQARGGDEAANLEIANQILSTFKFLD